MTNNSQVASIIMAAGRGSRMKNYHGNKTLLPLIPGHNPFEGRRPFIHNILENLPNGPKCIVVHHAKEEVIQATKKYKPHYCDQKTLNGTGGALLACKPFLEKLNCSRIIVTMGDVPLVQSSTFMDLIDKLDSYDMVVLGFVPESKRQYGLLQLEGALVKKIIEWKYWRNLPQASQANLTVCNSGIYAIKRKDLLGHFADLSSSPHVVQKQINGITQQFHEYFLTDLVEIFSANGKKVGYQIVKDPDEVMGVDDMDALSKVQKLYKARR